MADLKPIACALPDGRVAVYIGATYSYLPPEKAVDLLNQLCEATGTYPINLQRQPPVSGELAERVLTRYAGICIDQHADDAPTSARVDAMRIALQENIESLAAQPSEQQAGAVDDRRDLLAKALRDIVLECEQGLLSPGATRKLISVTAQTALTQAALARPASIEPVSGEAVTVETVGFVREDDAGDRYIDWTIEGGIHGVELGCELIASDAKLTDDAGSGEVYTHPAEPVKVPDDGIKRAAAYIQQKADDYAVENCGMEQDTGATTYHYGRAGEEYHHTLLELVDEITALAAAPGADGEAS